MTNFPLPEKTKVVKEETNKITYEISPLYPGYGVTIGNALRRVLLSSIDGSAITAIKIKGASHEFAALPGAMEDIIEVILNLKKVRIKSFSEEPVTLQLKVSGEKIVTASDIKTNSDTEIINPDQLIATLTDKKASLEMEITVEKGVGYVPVEQRQKEKISVGTIAIDAVFSPIKNVRMSVDDVRVGQRTDYNRLTLELETDGLIHPHQALNQAIKILGQHLELISEPLPDWVQKIEDKDKASSATTKSGSTKKKSPKTKKV